MRTLKISLLFFIVSITISAQSDPKRNYTEMELTNYYFIDSLLAENTVGGKFKYLFDYNTNGKINKWIRYWVTNGNLIEYRKLEYFYDNSNREIRTIWFIWHNNSWNSAHQTLSEYNQSNQLVYKLDQVYDDSLWQNSLKTIYSYDLNGNEKTVFKSFWSNNQWRNSRFTTNYYSSENLKDSTIILQYIFAWEDYYRITYNYNDTTKFLEQSVTQIWNGNYWENLSNLYISYDEYGNQIEHLILLWTIGGGGTWKNDIRKEFTYYDHYYVSGYCDKWNGTNWIPGDYLSSIINPDGLKLEFIVNKFTVYYKIVGVESEYNELVEAYRLSQNYPNPFNPSTKIKFEIPDQARNDIALVTLKVYDLLGREVATLVNEEKPAGEYEVEFTAANQPSGIYFYQIKAGKFTETKKMVLLK